MFQQSSTNPTLGQGVFGPMPMASKKIEYPPQQRPSVYDFDTPEQRIRYMLRNRGQPPANMPATDMEIEQLFGTPERPAL